jgi:DUF1365 family protein
MESCLYEGAVRHRRFGDVPHAFTFPLFLVYLDLAELDRVFRGRWLWSTSRPAFARFRREDHLGDPRVPLDRAVRDLVAERTGRRPEGPVRLLTHLRTAGHLFNPVSLFYCFDAGGALAALVADVSNTPWRERHHYVLPLAAGDARTPVATPKRFHVSPFLPLALEHVFHVREPGPRLVLRIEDRAPGAERVFDAVLALRRREISGANLARALVRFPLMPLQGIAAIYWQAFRLHRMRAPWFHHPARAREATHGELETTT